MRLAVILACHDRRPRTLIALRTVHASIEAAGAAASITLFDDGSTDGTAEAVAALPFDVAVVRGDGSAFWARGMALAERAALSRDPDVDALLWLNDDVEVDPDAIGRLLAVAGATPGAIVVGAVREPDGRVSYSGYRRAGLHPLRLDPVEPGQAPLPLDAFNGNLVLVPMDARRRIGPIDGGFAHQLADVDYGFRAGRVGVPVLLASGTCGVCPTNQQAPSGGVVADWRRFLTRTGGGHAASMRRILRREAPRSWPLWMVRTYALWWLRAARRLLRR